ncbi:MAG TPA: NADH-quinone oxidoreductase subunit NuoK [Nitrososphaerales archaeon]|nr:NADH-quinone oxidoreductase subunit NuoK [Nitrososphaerales archaeon]
MNSLADFVLVSAILFGIGIYGLVTKRNALRLLFAVEIMINAANLNFVAFGQYLPFASAAQAATPNPLGQTFVLFSIALAAAEAAVILAIVVVAFRLHQDVDVSELKSMGG